MTVPAVRGEAWANVMAFGAVGDGVHNDTAAIEAAIAFLPSGGRVYFPPGTYSITSTINVTTPGLVLAGTSSDCNFCTGGGAPSQLIWHGSGSAAMVAVVGPLAGWGIEDLMLEGSNAYITGLYVAAAQYGCVRNLYIDSCGQYGIHCDVVSGDNNNTMHNEWRNVTIRLGERSTTAAFTAWLLAGGSEVGGPNTCYEFVTNLTVLIDPGSPTNTSFLSGLYLQRCDSCTFEHVHMVNFQNAAGSVYCVDYDFTVDDGFPSGITLWDIDFAVDSTIAHAVGYAGTPATGLTNRIQNVSGVNERTPDPNIPWLDWEFGPNIWTAPTFLNSWSNSAGAAGYLKDVDGFVHLKGRLKGGGNGTVAFTLPAGFRPGQTDYYPMVVAGQASACAAVIDPSGDVTIAYTAGSATDVSLGGVTFLAEN